MTPNIYAGIALKYHSTRLSEMQLEKCLEICCTFLSATVEQITLKRRKRHTIYLRAIVVYSIRNAFPLNKTSLSDIGRLVGGFHHTTILNTLEMWENVIYHDKEAKLQTEILISLLKKLKY